MVVQMYRIPKNASAVLPKRFERKYYIAPKDAGLASMLLRQICRPDSEFPSEQINSLYFDTFDLDQHERSSSGDLRKDKVRIRWYGEENDLRGPQTIFIELKSREGFAGSKQRRQLIVTAEDLTIPGLKNGIVTPNLLTDTLAGFGYFPFDMLQPVIKISYWRHRCCDVMSGQRISLDSRIRSTMIMPGFGYGEKELPGCVIEVKGKTMELPVALRQMRLLETDWTRFSKYSACIDSHTDTPGSVGYMSPSGKIVHL